MTGSVEMQISEGLIKASADCSSSADARVFHEVALVFQLFVQQLLVNSGDPDPHTLLEELEGLHLAGQINTGVSAEGSLESPVICNGREVLDLLSGKLDAIQGAVQFVCDVLTIDHNVNVKHKDSRRKNPEKK